MSDQTPVTPQPDPAPMPEPAPAPVPNPAVVQDEGEKMTSGEMAATILSSIFFTPVVSLTLWIVWNQPQPVKAKQALKVFWIIIIVYVLLICCGIGAILTTGILGSMSSGGSGHMMQNGWY